MITYLAKTSDDNKYTLSQGPVEHVVFVRVEEIPVSDHVKSVDVVRW